MVSPIIFAVSLRVSSAKLATEITVISVVCIVKIWLKYNTSLSWSIVKLIIAPVILSPLQGILIFVYTISSCIWSPRFCLRVSIFHCTKSWKSAPLVMVVYSISILHVWSACVSCRSLVFIFCRYDGISKLRCSVCTVCVGVDPHAVRPSRHNPMIAVFLSIYWMNIYIIARITPIDIPTINDLIDIVSFSSLLLSCESIYPIMIPANTRYPGKSICLAIRKYCVPKISSHLKNSSPMRIVTKKKNPFMTSKNICICIS